VSGLLVRAAWRGCDPAADGLYAHEDTVYYRNIGTAAMYGNVVSDTIAETRQPPTREATLRRLQDWRSRVHTLYDRIEHALGTGYTYDRTGKQRSVEERVQQAGLTPEEVPPVDILRVERSGHQVMLILPRSLWIIGANGRLDLSLFPKSGGRRLYILYDLSSPLEGRDDWRIVRPSDGPHHVVFVPERLPELME
jgi:hypothetical protein